MFTFSGNKEFQATQANEPCKYKKPIKLVEGDFDQDETSTLHLLPCSIGHNGHAKVSNYFIINQLNINSNKDDSVKSKTTSSTTNNNNNVDTKEQKQKQPTLYTSSIRGIKLLGRTLDLPEDYKGYIFRQDISTDGSNNNSNNNNNGARFGVPLSDKWEAISSFSEYTYWNREKKPSTSDPQQQALKWLQISSVIHKPITKDQMEEIESKFIEKKMDIDEENLKAKEEAKKTNDIKEETPDKNNNNSTEKKDSNKDKVEEKKIDQKVEEKKLEKTDKKEEEKEQEEDDNEGSDDDSIGAEDEEEEEEEEEKENEVPNRSTKRQKKHHHK